MSINKRTRTVLLAVFVCAAAVYVLATSASMGARARAKSEVDVRRMQDMVAQIERENPGAPRASVYVSKMQIGSDPDELRLTVTPRLVADVAEAPYLANSMLTMWNRAHSPDEQLGTVVGITQDGVTVFRTVHRNGRPEIAFPPRITEVEGGR